MAQPFLLLPRASSAFFTHAILNTLSPDFAPGFVRAAHGLPVSAAPLCFALSFEKEQTQILKLRVMLASPELLRRAAAGDAPAFEHPLHHIRCGSGRVLCMGN